MKATWFISLMLLTAAANAQNWVPRFALNGPDSLRICSYDEGNVLHASMQPLDPTHPLTYLRFSQPEMLQSGLHTQVLGAAGGGASLSTTTRGLGLAQVGVRADQNWNNKVVLSATVAGQAEVLPAYLDSVVRATGILPGIGRAEHNGDVVIAPYLTGYVGWNLSKNFYAEAGHGKHFWGDGHRSLILSNNTAPYSYLRLETTGWHLKYVNLWAYLREYNLDGSGEMQGKFLAAHALDWNITKDFTLGFYEMVTWQARDTLSDRGFELNYLNPIAFYRPIEFAQGSADNVLLAMTWRWRASEHSTFYGQVLIDEFLLAEVRDRNGWWANKFGGQIGYSLSPVESGVSLQTEVNVVRPFTYTHGSVLQNYGHLSQSLAHPLGTNFLEWVTLLRYERNRLTLSGEYLWAIYGRDRDGENYGGNIYRSYESPSRQYNNTLAQGLKSTFHYAAVHGHFMAFPKQQTKLSASIAFRFEGNDLLTTRETFFWVGLTRGLLPTTRDF